MSRREQLEKSLEEAYANMTTIFFGGNRVNFDDFKENLYIVRRLERELGNAD